MRVVVNRMRPTLGWSERDIAGMVEGFARLAGVHFLPDDRATRRPGPGRRPYAVAESRRLRAGTALAAVAEGLVRSPSQPGRGAGRERSGDAQDENSR